MIKFLTVLLLGMVSFHLLPKNKKREILLSFFQFKHYSLSWN